MASTFSKRNRELAESLISLITGLRKEQDKENFQIAVRYVVSAFSSHSYLTVLPVDTLNRVKGITERFQHDSQHLKAKMWIALTSALKKKAKTANDEDNLSSILFLLMKLANLRARLPEDKTFDSILKVLEGNAERNIIDSSPDDSSHYEDPIISSDSEPESVTSSSSEEQNGLRDLGAVSADSGAGVSPDVEIRPPLASPCDKKAQDTEFYDIFQSEPLADNLMPHYWDKRKPRPKFFLHQALIQEIIWILSGVKDSCLFQWNGHYFSVREGTCLFDVPQAVLEDLLSDVCRCATYVVNLNDFFEGFTTLPRPRILQEFALAIKQAMKPVNQELINLEQDLNSDDKSLTLLMLLDRLRPTFRLVKHLWSLLQAAVVDRPPFVVGESCQAIHILHTVYKETILEDTVYGLPNSHVPVLVKIFLDTCKPFLDYTDQLLTEGHIYDPHYEFVIERCQEETCKKSGKVLVLHDIPSSYQQDFFLCQILQEVLLAASVVVMLKESNRWKSPDNCPPESLSAEYSARIKEELDLKDKVEEFPFRQSPPLSQKTPQPGFNIKDFFSDCDPLLKANFKRIFPFLELDNSNVVPKIAPCFEPPLKEQVTTPKNVKQSSNSPSECPSKNKQADFERSRQLNLFLEHTLFSLITAKYKSIHMKVMDVLKDDLCIEDHLKIIRKYCLFEEGSAMDDFTVNILYRILRFKPWASSEFVNASFQECTSDSQYTNLNLISLSVTEESTDLSLSSPLDELNKLNLHYSAPSLINLVLSPKNMQIYQKIFAFLLKLNCARTSVAMLKFNDLIDQKHCLKSRRDDAMFMHMLRWNFLHFIHELCHYFLTGVLHNKQVPFQSSLKAAIRFDNIVSIHQGHLEELQQYCLLSPSYGFLGVIICNILNLTVTFSRNWHQSTLLSRMDKMVLLEKEFNEQLWALHKALFLCQTGQAQEICSKSVNYSDLSSLLMVVSGQINVPRPLFSCGNN